MSVLKWKVAHAMNLRNESRKAEKAKIKEAIVRFNNEQINIDIQEPRQLRKRVRQESQISYFDSRKSTSSKNIMKNYSRALVSFAISHLAVPYLEQELAKHNLEVEDFQDFIKNNQESVNCIKGLRELLLPIETDSDQIKNFKRAFQEISIVFVKYFSVNWIFNSKVADKMTHLTYRFKILRRLQNPQYFTYLENFAK